MALKARSETRKKFSQQKGTDLTFLLCPSKPLPRGKKGKKYYYKIPPLGGPGKKYLCPSPKREKKIPNFGFAFFLGKRLSF